MGVAVVGYRIRDGEWSLLGYGDPRRPQSFLPIRNDVEIRSGDYLAANLPHNPESHS